MRFFTSTASSCTSASSAARRVNASRTEAASRDRPGNRRRLRIDEVGLRCRPGRGKQRLDFREEGRRQAIERLLVGALIEETTEHASLFHRNAHAPAKNRIEATDGVGDWNEAARKAPKPLEMPADAGRKSEAVDLPEPFCGRDGVIDGRRAECLREGDETLHVARWRIAAEGDDPSPVLDRKMKPRRLLCGALSRCRTPIQSGASSGIAKMAEA